jgi:putative ABC transport system substrate-binding protein
LDRGKSIRIEYQFGDGQLSRLGDLAAELVRHNVNVIVTVDTPPTQAAQKRQSSKSRSLLQSRLIQSELDWS